MVQLFKSVSLSFVEMPNIFVETPNTGALLYSLNLELNKGSFISFLNISISTKNMRKH